MNEWLRTSRGWLPIGLLLPALATVPREAHAQGGVRGQVVDAVTSQGLTSVQVFIPGTQLGAVTNADGRFLLLNVAAGQVTVRAVLIGYSTEEAQVQVPAQGTVDVNFQMRSTVINLDEIVVTGTGAPSQRRQLGQTIVSVTSQDLQRTPITRVEDILQGRVPGITGMGFSEPGASAQILLRGTPSLSQRNEPLIYVDGVRMDNRRADVGGAGTAWSRLMDINPADIESIEVIKGAAAATIFGTEASAGVIQILTKRGASQAPVYTFQVDLHTMHNRPYPDQVEWSPRHGELLRQNPAEMFLRTGYQQNYTASVRGGGGSVQYYASGRWMKEIGTHPNHDLRNTSLRTSLDFSHGERLRTTLDMSVNSGKVDASYRSWSTVANDYLLHRPSTWDNLDEWGRDAFDRMRDALLEKNWGEVTNVLISGSASYDVREGMVANLRVGRNQIWREDFQTRPERVVSPTSRGTRRVRDRDSHATTFEATVSWNQRISDRLQSTLSAGAQSFWQGIVDKNVTVLDFPSPTLNTLSGASTISNVSEFKEEVINAGMFLQEQLGMDNRLFLTLGGRVDGNSAFGDDFGFAVYPKAGLSWVLSEYDFWNVPGVDEFRIRGAVGTSGLQPGAFDSERTWRPGIFAGNVAKVEPFNLGNPELKPERSTEREIAIEAGLFGGRLGLDLVYFNQTTKDALLAKEAPPSTGFVGSRLVNVGQLDSWGLELASEVKLVERSSFGWSMNAAFTWIDQVVTSMGGVPPWRIEGRRRWSWVQEGYRPGAVIAPIQNPARPYTTKVSIDKLTHLDQIEPVTLKTASGADSLVYIGNSLPDWTVDFATNFRLGSNITLSALFTGAGGFIMSNETASLRLSNYYAEGAGIPMMILQDPKSTTEQRRAAADAFGKRHPLILSSMMSDGDYLKLNEVTLNYDVPAQFSSRLGLGRTTVTIGGRNLHTWTSYWGLIDPGTTGGGFTGTSPFLQNIEYLTAPSHRRFILSIRTTR